MPDSAAEILASVLEHPLLGPYAAYQGTVSIGPTSTVFSDPGLVTYSNDTRYRGYRAFFPNYVYASQERFIYSTNLATGQVQFMQPLVGMASGDAFVLLRDFAWGAQGGNENFLGYLNDTCRSLYFDQEVIQRGITNLYKYTLPTPISAGGWVYDVYLPKFPAREWSNQMGPGLAWYRLNPLNIEGDLYLILNQLIDASVDLVYEISRPYLHPHMSAFTMTRSVLTPFGQSTAVSVPRNLLVAGTIWRILRAKVRNLTGDAREVWSQNLSDAARWYATECASAGVRKVGAYTLGYNVPW